MLLIEQYYLMVGQMAEKGGRWLAIGLKWTENGRWPIVIFIPVCAFKPSATKLSVPRYKLTFNTKVPLSYPYIWAVEWAIFLVHVHVYVYG